MANQPYGASMRFQNWIGHLFSRKQSQDQPANNPQDYDSDNMTTYHAQQHYNGTVNDVRSAPLQPNIWKLTNQVPPGPKREILKKRIKQAIGGK